MDEMVEVDGMAHPAIVDDSDVDPHEGEINNVEDSSLHDEDGIIEPYVGMEFESEDDTKTFYDEYARRFGFSSKIGQLSRSKSDGTIIAREFVCGRECSKRKSADSCDAMLRIELKDQDKWVVTKFVKEHSHSTVNSSKVHYLRPRRHFAGAAKTMTEAYTGSAGVPSGVMSLLMDDNRASAEKNRGVRTTSSQAEANRSLNNASTMNYAIRNARRKRTLGRDAQNMLEYFKKMQSENPGFFYAIQLDEDNRMANVFWADARSRAAYSHFGDAVTLDTMYRVNQFRVPFAPFTGVNHHGQTILFGCALLLDESEASFVWLFKTFLTAMNDRQPISITTDQDRAIHVAVAQVFPEARHCISKWHVLREGQQKLASVCLTHPNFQVELYNCINLTETIEEFESAWNCIIEKYNLAKNDWLQSLYNARAQWVPVYVRDSFFAVISPNQGYDDSFLDGYVNQQTTLPLFFRQYERALENWFEKEIEADFDTMCTTPVLRTPSPMEKQAANLYTRKIFAKFQEELVETFVYTANRIEGDAAFSTFRVAKFEDDQKAYVVTLNYSDMKANCSCQMFEYSGILCRHVLTVFTVTNVLTLPSHYILKRWTRNARSGLGSDERAIELHGQESLSSRYNSLCREAIRFAEEGATAPETYTVAITALKEAGKKVAIIKKNVAKVAPPSSQVSGASYDERKTSASASDTTPLLWPRQDEVMRRFNLNNAGAPVQSITDLNYPHISPVTLHRDDNPPDHMAVLPYLKSMTWVMENKNSTTGNRVAVINLKLQDYSKSPSAESEVKFQLSRVSLEPMLRSMAYISEQLSTPANKVAVINLKLQDTETTSGESEVKFQVSRDTLGAMLRSMAYIREQLSNTAETQSEPPLPKKQRK
ncbi:protein FAR1-RELATED SEQUENCE 3-like [Cucurbita maxima]|uniref:Protein FAR1-RELATED SEQUENCE n=1 Tax=Cucurbita maxima TaxID=3661 RepID=A0A6J1HUH6_CUCMA|nr:protein FAR1-RELATED SEQUENCE 3-like [Cucurbita maxima]XP_022966684.1 protein FAR1-RELATED SEQUENCE 3-like [Cucurbita maxima]XP_022966690.1 protein FAR1-RELATED SEQUENCE 3-like [Cucurbita maxima]XP_022966693.1 protein FAR1-RELATED SEQUENCE 3-like [Cucurbita maxima]